MISDHLGKALLNSHVPSLERMREVGEVERRDLFCLVFVFVLYLLIFLYFKNIFIKNIYTQSVPFLIIKCFDEAKKSRAMLSYLLPMGEA
jgi:hypothetical protein